MIVVAAMFVAEPEPLTRLEKGCCACAGAEDDSIARPNSAAKMLHGSERRYRLHTGSDEARTRVMVSEVSEVR
jgi:hypothetical protein